MEELRREILKSSRRNLMEEQAVQTEGTSVDVLEFQATLKISCWISLSHYMYRMKWLNLVGVWHSPVYFFGDLYHR